LNHYHFDHCSQLTINSNSFFDYNLVILKEIVILEIQQKQKP